MKIIALHCVFIFIVIGCAHNKTVNDEKRYEQEADNLLNQVLIDMEHCGCIVEPPIQSLLDIALMENPASDPRKYLTKVLKVSDNTLDSLSKISLTYKLDKARFESSCYSVISRSEFESRKGEMQRALANKCMKGIMCPVKPVFNKDYSIAVINVKPAYVSIGSPNLVYKYDGKKWIHYPQTTLYYQ